jgi:hypothetical protein
MSYNDYINYSIDPIDKPRLYGIYKGIVTNNIDHTNSSKLSVMVPQIIGGQSFDSVPPCGTTGSDYLVPDIGDNVWVAFESGDTSFPVWIAPSVTYTTTTSGALGYYGSFYSNTTQTSSTSGIPITFDGSSENNGISISSSSRITFTHAGTYNVQFAGQLHQTSNGSPAINIWMKKNGVDVPDSTWQYDLSNQMHFSVPAFNYIATFAAGDYVQFYWTATSTIYLTYFPASTSPTYPITPSVVVNVVQVMNTQVGPQGPAGPAGGVLSVDTLTGAVDLTGKYLTQINAASTYEPKITAGTTAQYWRGDKTWQTFPTALSSFSNDTNFITSSALTGYLTSSTASTTYAPIAQTMYLGTTSVAINRPSATGLSLSGVSIDGSSGSTTGNAATVTNGVYTTTTSLPNVTSASALATVGTITSGTWNGSIVPVLYGGTGLSFNDKTLVGRGTQLAGVSGSATGGTMTNAFQDSGTPKYILVDSASVYYFEAYFPIQKAASTAASSWQVSVIYQDTSGTSLTPVYMYTAVNAWTNGTVETSVTSASANTAISFGSSGTTAVTRLMRLVGYITTNSSTAGRMSIGFGQSANASSGTPSTGANAFIAVYKMSTGSDSRVGNWV